MEKRSSLLLAISFTQSLNMIKLCVSLAIFFFFTLGSCDAIGFSAYAHRKDAHAQWTNLNGLLFTLGSCDAMGFSTALSPSTRILARAPCKAAHAQWIYCITFSFTSGSCVAMDFSTALSPSTRICARAPCRSARTAAASVGPTSLSAMDGRWSRSSISRTSLTTRWSSRWGFFTVTLWSHL